MASSRMPRLKLGGQRVPQPVRVHAGDPGAPSDPPDDPADLVPVQRAAVVGDQPLAAADVLEVGCGPGREQAGQLGVQRHVPVGAGLAEGDPQPVPGADLHDRVGVQACELAGVDLWVRFGRTVQDERFSHRPLAFR